MFPYIYFNIQIFSNTIFDIYYITPIIIKLCLSFIVKIYTIFYDLYIVVNFHVLKKKYVISTKQFKKNKKRKLQKMGM